jgi:hypothetical protein
MEILKGKGAVVTDVADENQVEAAMRAAQDV